MTSIGPKPPRRSRSRRPTSPCHPGFEVEGEDADDIGFVLRDAEGRPIESELQRHDMRQFGGPARFSLVLRRSLGGRPRHEVTDPAGGREAASDDDRVTLGQVLSIRERPQGRTQRAWPSVNFVESLPRFDTEHLYILQQLSGVLSRP